MEGGGKHPPPPPPSATTRQKSPVLIGLTSRKYKKKLLKCYELLVKITSSLATFEVLISLSLNDGTIINAKEFHKLQTLYLQLMTHVRNIDRKMKVETEETFKRLS